MSSPIAIVARAGQFPGASDLPGFWDTVAAGRSTSREIPADRQPVPIDPLRAQDHGTLDRLVSSRACLLDPFPTDDLVEPVAALGHDLRELDPLTQLVLRVGRDAHDAAASLDPARTGVVLANIALPTDTSSRLSQEVLGRAFEAAVLGRAPAPDVRPFDRYVTGYPTTLLARLLDLRGGTYTLDAACASSLYAVHFACEELRAGRLDAVLAGGVSRPQCLYTNIGFSQLHALSPSGRCAPFDQTADGLVVGEGAGVFVLKRLDDARRDGDTIHAVIRGAGLSNDVGGSLLKPDSEGQLRAMRQAYADAGLSLADVDLVECHGTGTPAGDAVELRSLATLWSEAGSDRACVIGSVKSNVGHLLTGAGAAGLMKVLLALEHKTLPPSANFDASRAHPGLADTPFRVLDRAEPWATPTDRPRRAAVSGFGFGGINAHLIVEEPPVETASSTVEVRSPEPPEALALVGLGARVGALRDVDAFRESVLGGIRALERRPASRWRGVEQAPWFPETLDTLPGAWIDTLEIPVGRFKLPPRELPDVLPQQLLMLQVADQAVRDAGAAWPNEAPRLRCGCVVGMGLDMETTTFQVGWDLEVRTRQWAKQLGLTGEAAETWANQLVRAFGPGLDATRTLGALGGMIASRIARELRCGGPSFTVSCEGGSGLRALEVGARLLQRHELDAVVVGAVDLSGDVRSVWATDAHRPYTRSGEVRPFDAAADGSAPADGAAAVVLKRLSDAERDGDRIYAVLRGVGAGSGGDMEAAYTQALEAAYAESQLDAAHVGFVEAHGSGAPDEDRAEGRALARFFPADSARALGSAKSVVGDAGAAGGMVSLVKAALALHAEVLPPLPSTVRGREDVAWAEGGFHFPLQPQSWLRDRKSGPRVAGVSSVSVGGDVLHAVLAQWEGDPGLSPARRRPLGERGAGLFLVAAAAELDTLRDFVEDPEREGWGIDSLAAGWHARHPERRVAWRCFAVGSKRELLSRIDDVRGRPDPERLEGEVAWLFPGSGNHYLGQGRDLLLAFPEVVRTMDRETSSLASQAQPWRYVPWRRSWGEGWRQEAEAAIGADPHAMIFGQVAHGIGVARALEALGVRCDAIIGYSLGESTGLISARAWTDRDALFERARESSLFTTRLVGPCEVLRESWGVEPAWTVAVFERPAADVRAALADTPERKVRLLIVNAPQECVVGGQRDDVEALAATLGATARLLEGVPAVHCDGAEPAVEDYRALHLQPVTTGVRVYSGNWGRSYDLTPESAADSIAANARHGVDYPKTIEQAYADGVRFFVEAGPQGSCARMVRAILGDRPHLAVTACRKGRSSLLNLLDAVGRMVERGLPVDLEALYGPEGWGGPLRPQGDTVDPRRLVQVPLGGPAPELPPTPARAPQPAPKPAAPPHRNGVSRHEPTTPSVQTPARQPIQSATPRTAPPVARAPEPQAPPAAPRPRAPEARPVNAPQLPAIPQGITLPDPWGWNALTESTLAAASATAEAHAAFLQMSEDAARVQAQLLGWQAHVLGGPQVDLPALPAPSAPTPSQRHEDGVDTQVLDASTARRGTEVYFEDPTEVTYDREQCMQLAIGSIAAVFGPEFAEVDTYPTRVRLPDEPLMLVDRIVRVEGEPNSLQGGRIITEHDVFPDDWYLDGGRAPVCISVESGQADLILSGYLGIDSQTKGLRVYRLLDAEVVFHRDLPRPGERIRYDIRIDKFMRQGSTWLFFFRFEGYIGDEHLITMRDGCAGFFTYAQLANSRGIVEQPGEPPQRRVMADGRPTLPFAPLVPPASNETLDAARVEALRQGDLGAAFGGVFQGRHLHPALRLPGGLMNLVHRVIELDTQGGRYGQGVVATEFDVDPRGWYLTCHFSDDMVMPGTLMYEGCLHTLRVLLLRMGWTPGPDWTGDLHYAPIEGVPSRLKCRGQVIETTKLLTYRIELKEIGYDPEPYILGDAFMYVDGRKAVQFENVSCRLAGTTGPQLEASWGVSAQPAPAAVAALEGAADRTGLGAPEGVKPAIYTSEQILAFAIGKPSEAFGEPYRVFDEERRIARLPGPPLCFVDRVTLTQPEPWKLEPGGWIEAQYDVPRDAWYFEANRQTSMPFMVILETALQPCGWLAAYLGSALTHHEDLHFRNLGGKATLYGELEPEVGTVTVRARLTATSFAAGMILQEFDFQLWAKGRILYDGTTQFGFFPAQALANQVGVRGAGARAWAPEAGAQAQAFDLAQEAPVVPDDCAGRIGPQGLRLPSRALLMLERIDTYLPDGGPHGLGFIRGAKRVEASDWFFKAHFYQDPVIPGSLGLEGFLQLLKVVARDKFPELIDTHRFEPIAVGEEHTWVYRGQVIPSNEEEAIEAVITGVEGGERPVLRANGFLRVDGKIIYEMLDFALRLVPESDPPR